MSPDLNATTLRLGLPKGRLQNEVFALLDAAGLTVRTGPRAYRPTLAGGAFDTKLLKPQNIVEMLSVGTRDLGFAGADWVAELDADLIEVLDTALDPVRIVAATTQDFLEPITRRGRLLTVATEYPRIAAEWVASEGLDARIVRTYGATEVFPPDDADIIVDNTTSGATLAANGLGVIATLRDSSTRLYASRAAMADPLRRSSIGGMVMLLSAVLDARQRVMFEVNVGSDRLEGVCALLPCMREPTIAALHGGAGHAVKAAVPRQDLPTLILRVKAAGGTDVVITPIVQIVA